MKVTNPGVAKYWVGRHVRCSLCGHEATLEEKDKQMYSCVISNPNIMQKCPTCGEFFLRGLSNAERQAEWRQELIKASFDHRSVVSVNQIKKPWFQRLIGW